MERGVANVSFGVHVNFDFRQKSLEVKNNSVAFGKLDRPLPATIGHRKNKVFSSLVTGLCVGTPLKQIFAGKDLPARVFSQLFVP